ncbi:MAG: PQQ-binding-like beta-propeller repeat protein [Christensenellales bacterium]|jgi:outer membrane protein assembly factor BamB
MKKRYYARRRSNRRKARARFFVIIAILIVALVAGIYFIVKAVSEEPGSADKPNASVKMTPPSTEEAGLPTEEVTESAEPTPTSKVTLSADLVPQATRDTDPDRFDFKTTIMKDGTEVDSYQREDTISFGSGDEYTELEGIITFRGNNYRNAPSYGTAEITEGKLEIMRTKETGRIGDWGGLAWTGQPLIVKWPAKTRENMTMIYDEFRTKEDFIEVIVCSLDGNIYFMDLETGDKTRDPIKIGAPTKGTASLDPRGYPIIYVGQGLNPEGSPTACNDMFFRAFSLIDGTELMKFGSASCDPFAYRNWQAYDSSALIDTKTDTLIEPGENGVIYTCKLNTVYDAEAGTVTMDYDPVKVKYRYTSTRNEAADSSGRWGVENSAVAWRDYLIFTDNVGMLQCLNLNTMTPVYTNDVTDDSDVSMVLEEDIANNTFYLYTGCEFDEGVRKGDKSYTVYARKLNGITGEIIWEVPFTTVPGYPDGGILASPVLGNDGTSMAGLIIYNITKEKKGDSSTSRVVALDKETGKLRWEYDMGVAGWSPSSPVPVYTAEGKGYIVQCTIKGNVALIDGATGKAVDVLNVGEENFEATPAIYGNTIVVGSRSDHIFFIKIK